MNRILPIVIVFVSLLLGRPQGGAVARAAGDDDAPGKSVGAADVEAREKMVKSAKMTYEATQAAYDVGAAPFSDLYTWSRRWLESERAATNDNAGELAALRDHSERMTQLCRKVKALDLNGVEWVEAEKIHAAQFQVAEAELWLVAAATDDDAPGVAAAAAATARQAMVKAAKRTYEATQAAWDVGAARFSDLCIWSLRWLESERARAKDNDGKLAALKDHSERMTQLYRKVKELQLLRVAPPHAVDVHVAEFHVAEAELWLAAVSTDDDAPGVAAGYAAAKARNAMLKAAEKTYGATHDLYQLGMGSFAELYAWSRLWLEAERALAKNNDSELAALKNHWKRIANSFLKVKALYQSGSKGGEAEKFHAAEFYLAEAKLWLIAARGTVPDEPE